MGALRPFFLRGEDLANVNDTERVLEREVTQRVESGLPGVEVLALELVSPSRFCVYVDHPQGVDHALCGRVTDLLRGYLDRYSVDVSSPGLERPLRKPGHFQRAVGRNVTVKTRDEIEGRKRFRGEVVAAGDQAATVGVDGAEVSIPYTAIVRANLIDEGKS
jgi:ribosome maturation factor RimP